MDSAFVSTTHEAIVKLAQNPRDATDEAQMVIFHKTTFLCQSAK